jgi:hypothetical protein
MTKMDTTMMTGVFMSLRENTSNSIAASPILPALLIKLQNNMILNFTAACKMILEKYTGGFLPGPLKT